MNTNIQIYVKKFRGMATLDDEVKILPSKTRTRAFPEGIIITASPSRGYPYSKELTIYFVKRNIPLDQISAEHRSWITQYCIMRMYFSGEGGWSFHISGNLNEIYYDYLSKIKEFCKDYLENHCYNHV